MIFFFLLIYYFFPQYTYDIYIFLFEYFLFIFPFIYKEIIIIIQYNFLISIFLRLMNIKSFSETDNHPKIDMYMG